MTRTRWGWHKSRFYTDKDAQPKGYTYWDEENGRWRKRSPIEHEDWMRTRVLKRGRYKQGLDWKAHLRKLETYRLTQPWFDLRQQVAERDNHECVICASNELLQCHHLHYDNVFKEELGDLVTLCKDCHKAIHYKEDGKRRRDWKTLNPKLVLPKGENDAIPKSDKG